jgi:hypothetical protein
MASVTRPKKGRKQAAPVKQPLYRKVLAGLLGAIGLGASLLAYSELMPRVTVTASDPAVSDEPFSTTVTIANTGSIPLEKVVYGIGLQQLGSHDVILLGDHYGDVLRPDQTPVDLRTDDRFSFPLSRVIQAKNVDLTSADIAIVVIYQVPFIHWRRTRAFPMTARRNSNGTFSWDVSPTPSDFSVKRVYRIASHVQLPHFPEN